MEGAEDMARDVLSGHARSGALAPAGRSVESLSETTQVYEAGVKVFERG